MGVSHGLHDMSCAVRKPAFCICVNKDADQLRGHDADQRLCFRCTDSKSLYFLNPKFQATSFFVDVQPRLCGTRLKKPNTGFLTTRLIYFHYRQAICDSNA